MMENNSEIFRPSIVVDMKKNRIRIHQKTLHALGDPDFVVLIINPEEHTIGIKCSTLDNKLAHRIRIHRDITVHDKRRCFCRIGGTLTPQDCAHLP